MALRQILGLLLVMVVWFEPQTAATTITGPNVSPGAIGFSSPDPDNTPVSGNNSATVQWGMDGHAKGDWSLSVQADSPSLTDCPDVPVSAITVRCDALTRSGTAHPTGACVSGALPLSGGPQTLASGTRQGGNSTITATLSFTFTDSWRYRSSPSCSVHLTYTIYAE